MNTNKEVRAFHSDSIELRKAAKASDNEQKYVDGIGVVYEKEEMIYDNYYEQVSRDAFKNCLSTKPEIKSFFNHNPDYVLSTSTSNPALQLTDLGDGLFFSSPIPDTSYGRDLEENLKRKNVVGASFTFSVNRDNVTVDEKGCYHRTILDATIYEVGPVTSPAYLQTQVSLRDRDSLLDEAKKRTTTSDVAELKAIQDKENEYRRNLISLLEINN